MVWASALVVLAGCKAAGPTGFPAAPTRVDQLADGGVARVYDLRASGAGTYREVCGADGRAWQLEFDRDGDGHYEETSPRGAAGGSAAARRATQRRRHLLIIVDSVPFEMVRDAWNQGRFRLFYPPSRVISVFPVMTDPALAEFFGATPLPGVEAQFYDGQRLQSGYGSYLAERNAPWVRFADYRLRPNEHLLAYAWPGRWFGYELQAIAEGFARSSGAGYVGYCVSTSGLGFKRGRDGHQIGLVHLDRFCQQLMVEHGGEIEITLMSDHGHDLLRGRRVRLRDQLARIGYRVTTSLRGPQDVVVPEYGPVSCAALYTRSPAAVAADLVGLEAAELVAYRRGTDDAVIVLGRAGRAVIQSFQGGLSYKPEIGDPLGLGGARTLNAAEWFEQTADAEFPDAVCRLWRAFHGLFVHTPDVLVSLRDGWYAGNPDFTRVIALSAAHGNLRRASSTAFAMTTLGRLPEVLRMSELRAELGKLGEPVEATRREKIERADPN